MAARVLVGLAVLNLLFLVGELVVNVLGVALL